MMFISLRSLQLEAGASYNILLLPTKALSYLTDYYWFLSLVILRSPRNHD